MCEMVPDYRDGWRRKIKEQELTGTTISTFVMDEPMTKNDTDVKEHKTSDDREMLDRALKENYLLREKIDQVSTMCDRWFNGLSPADKIEMMVRYYQLRLNCYENNKKESK